MYYTYKSGSKKKKLKAIILYIYIQMILVLQVQQDQNAILSLNEHRVQILARYSELLSVFNPQPIYGQARLR